MKKMFLKTALDLHLVATIWYKTTSFQVPLERSLAINMKAHQTKQHSCHHKFTFKRKFDSCPFTENNPACIPLTVTILYNMSASLGYIMLTIWPSGWNQSFLAWTFHPKAQVEGCKDNTQKLGSPAHTQASTFQAGTCLKCLVCLWST